MTALAKLAAFVQSPGLAHMPDDRLDRVKRHIVDTCGAQIAGSQTDDGVTIGQLIAADGPMSSVVVACAHARCTEIDDIHLSSCTTPGSVVVPTARALASAQGMAATSVRAFCAAVLAGYESMIRLGVAIDGPVVLHAGTWPTGFAAAFGSAATAARLLGLSVEETASALATALAFAQHRAVASSPARSSRWLSLGVAAASGVMAARGARAGLVGAIDAGARLAAMTRGLGKRYFFDETGMKPYPTARQALAAIEAVRDIARAEQLSSGDVDAVLVGLPERQRVIVDRRGFPESRFESIVNVRYQIALAIAAPGQLRDVRRTPIADVAGVRRLMAKIRVQRARDLDNRYPRCWPARVEIRTRGQCFTRVVLHPRGDARNPLDWAGLAAKLSAIAGPAIGVPAVNRFIAAWRTADLDAPIPAFP